MPRCFTLFVVLLSTLALAGCPRREPSAPPVIDSAGTTPGTPATPVESTSTPAQGEDSPPSETSIENTPPAALAPDEAWLAKLGSEDREELKSATEHFAALEDKALPLLQAHVNHPSAAVRRGAIFGLYSRFDARDSQLVDTMVAALNDDDRGVRQVALEAINKLPKKSFVAVIPQLVPRLSDQHEPDPQLRAQTARMLARQETAAQAALAALNAAVQHDPDFQVRSAALFAVYNVARDADEALPAPLYAVAHDRDPRLRRIAAERLAKYGAAAATATPQLIAALADSGVPARAADDPLRGQDEPVCLAAVAALVSIGEPAVEQLVDALKSENRQVRVLAMRTLGDIGPVAKAALPALAQAAASSDPNETAAAKTALAKIQRTE